VKDLVVARPNLAFKKMPSYSIYPFNNLNSMHDPYPKQ
jgi:hypothetical protein